MSKNIKERFYDNIVVNSENGCWEWMGTRNRKGYGVFSAYGFKHMAHRFSWLLHKNQFPNELYVLHKCDNPPCVNPKHLFLGTQLDNMQDMVKKNRNPNLKGDKNPRAILSDRDVIEIRRLWDEEKLSPKELSTLFDTPKSTVNKIISSDTWKHLPPRKNSPSNRGSHLSDNDVFEIKRLYSLGRLSQAFIGKMFRLSQAQVSKIVLGDSWA